MRRLVCENCHTSLASCSCGDTDTMLSMVTRAVRPTLSTLYKQGIETGAIKPAYHYSN